MKLDKVIGVRTSKTIYKEDDKTVKVFEDNFSKADILNEALNQARVEETGLNIPKLSEVTKIEGKWAIISDFVDGKTLEQLMAENPNKKDEYLNLFVDLQLEMHSKKCPLLNKLRDKLERQISSTNIDDTTKYDLHTRLDSMPKHNKVCHGDFNPSNIIIKADGTPFIIDWSHATQGNASADVATTYLLFVLSGDKDMAEKYLNLFCEKSNTEKKYVQKWIPVVAAARLSKGNEKEKEFLSDWIDVVDYE